MDNMKYDVVKSSRKYLGYAYSGPALSRTTFSEQKDASFDTLETAIRCARQLNEENPVGFHIYHQNKLVWPEGAVAQQAVYPDVVAPDPLALRIAVYVQKTAKAREDSFDKGASNKAQQKADADWEREKAEGSQHYYLNVVDHAQFYRLNLRQAAEATVPPAFVEPVYLLLQLGWNDALDWAKRIVENKPC